MKVLVTGGAGFIGSNISAELVKCGHDVVVLDNYLHGNDKNVEEIIDKIELVKGSICDFELVIKLAKNCEVILHQAAAPSSPMFMKDLRGCTLINVDGFVNVLNAAKENDVKRVVYASTSSIYGNNKPPLTEDMKIEPVNFYSSTKLLNEHMAILFSREYDIETVGLRYFSVYGPNEMYKGSGGVYANLVSQFLWSIMNNEQPVIYGDGSQKRDFTYVKDAVQANILAMESKKTLMGEIFNVATGSRVSFNNLVSIIGNALGKNVKPKYIKMPVKGYISDQIADISKIKTVLGYKPKYTLEDGIKDVLIEIGIDV